MSSSHRLPCSIVDVVKLLGIHVIRNTGTELHCRCPFCDDEKAHLNIRINKNVFRCNRCGAAGGVLHLYAQFHQISTSAAYEELTHIFSEKRAEAVSRTPVSRPVQNIAAANVAPEVPLAASSVRNNTYSNLLSLLTLASSHRESLLERGLSDEEILSFGYKTTPAVRTGKIVAQLLERGCELEGVPGFYCDESGRWKLDIRSSGIMIPDRNSVGEIEAIQIRLDQTSKSKYINLTSVDKNLGRSVTCCPHYVGLDQGTKSVYLTEGVLKADVAYSLATRLGKHITVVGITGVSNFNQVKRALAELEKRNIRKILLAFDMDADTNPNVQRAKEKVLEIGTQAGFEMTPIRWNSDYKGIDDVMLHYVTLDKVKQHIHVI